MTTEEFWAEVAKATKLVASWPKWKQNILEQSGKPTVDVPRQPIVDTAHQVDRLAQLLGMQAENMQRQAIGASMAYVEEDFLKV
jgi:hypothetical protein